MRSTRRALWFLLYAAASPAVSQQPQAPSPTPVAAWLAEPADTEQQHVLVELRLGHIASRTVETFRVRDEVLVPMSAFLQLAEIPFHLSPEGRLDATVDPGRQHLLVDFRRDTMSLGSRHIRIEREVRVFRDHELYVGAKPLGDLLGSPFVVDFSELTVTLADPGDLPLARRLRRDAARVALLRTREVSHPDLVLGYERPQWDGLVFDYSIFAPSGDPVGGSGYSGALGADVLGGSLELAASSVGRAAAGVARIDGSWTGVWRTNPWLQQLRLGDGSSTGPRIRSVRGVSISNAPYIRPSVLGDVPYRGQLGPGGAWSIEAYRGNQLVAFDSADLAGRFTLDLPVQYGENPVDFVAYGPQGEILEFNQTYRVLSELLRAKRFEYGVSAGSCRSPLCSATGNVDLRYGATERWTVRAGIDQFWRATAPNLWHPYLSLAGSPTNAWAVVLDGVGAALGHGGVQFEPSINLRLTGDYTQFAMGTVAPVLTPLGAHSDLRLSGFVRPLPRASFFFFDGTFDRLTGASGVTTNARVETSTQGQEVRLLPFARLERAAPVGASALTHWFVGVNTFVLPRPSLGPVFGPIWLRSAVEVGVEDALRLTAYSVSAARAIGPSLRLEGGTTWLRGSPGPIWTLTLTSYLPSLRSFTTLTAPTGGVASGTQYVQGSLLWDRATGRFTTAPGPSLERSGVSGRVFFDENGNGLPDPGESGIPGVRVRVGTATAVSDSDGVFRVWDVVPFEPVAVAVDSLSLTSPLLVPAFATAVLEPGPNRFQSLDIPIVRAGVIEGLVSREVAGRWVGVPGAQLILTYRRTGARRSFTTFSDGAFYALGVKPGDYDLTVDPRALDALGATVTPLHLTLAPTAERVGATGLELRLTPKR